MMMRRRWSRRDSLIEQVTWSYSIGNTMRNFRNLVTPSVKMWLLTPILTEEFQKANQEIINRVKDSVEANDINKLMCVSTDWSKLGVGFPLTQKYCKCDLEKAPVCLRMV